MTSVASRAKTSVAAAEDTVHLNGIDNTLAGVPSAHPKDVVGEIEMSGVFSAAATDVFAPDTTDAFSAYTTDVLFAARAASGVFLPSKL